MTDRTMTTTNTNTNTNTNTTTTTTVAAAATIMAKRRRFDLIQKAVKLALSHLRKITRRWIGHSSLWRESPKAIEAPPVVAVAAAPHVDMPPPPYADEWTAPAPVVTVTTAVAPRSKRIVRVPSASRRTGLVRRRSALRNHQPAAPAPAPVSTTAPELEPEVHGELDDQMEWMNDRLRGLIEQGQKALRTEIVLEAEGQDNEHGAVDDGADGWEETDAPQATSSAPRLRRAPSRRLRVSPSRSSLNSHSPPKRTIDLQPRREDEEGQSRELRETMEKVRRAYGVRAPGSN